MIDLWFTTKYTQKLQSGQAPFTNIYYAYSDIQACHINVMLDPVTCNDGPSKKYVMDQSFLLGAGKNYDICKWKQCHDIMFGDQT